MAAIKAVRKFQKGVHTKAGLAGFISRAKKKYLMGPQFEQEEARSNAARQLVIRPVSRQAGIGQIEYTGQFYE